MICTPFTGQPVKGVHITTEGLLYMQKRRFSTKDRRFIVPYYLKRMLNKFCDNESKELNSV